MARNRFNLLQLNEPTSKALLAGGMGALLGFSVLLVSVGITADVRLKYTTNSPIPIIPFPLYVGIGAVSIGGVVGILYQRYQTGTPPLASTVITVYALGQTWWTIRTRDKPTVGETFPQPLGRVTALEYLLLGWPLLLGGVLLLAGIERYFTHRQLE